MYFLLLLDLIFTNKGENFVFLGQKNLKTDKSKFFSKYRKIKNKCFIRIKDRYDSYAIIFLSESSVVILVSPDRSDFLKIHLDYLMNLIQLLFFLNLNENKYFKTKYGLTLEFHIDK